MSFIKSKIPDQYYGPDLDELEEMKNDSKIKSCPNCGYKLYVSGTIIEKAYLKGQCIICGFDLSKHKYQRGEGVKDENMDELKRVCTNLLNGYKEVLEKVLESEFTKTDRFAEGYHKGAINMLETLLNHVLDKKS